MADYQIPISYVVSASLVAPSRGLEPLKMSTLLILTEDEAVNELTTSYEIYRTASSIARQWGTNSRTTLMANSVFSQSPNLLANDGYVIVAPYTTIDATSGTLTTEDLTENLSNFASVSDGSLKLNIDGSSTEKNNIDFSDIDSIQGIAQKLQSEFTNITINAVDNKIVFTSATTGNSSEIQIETAENGGTDLSGSLYLDSENAVTVQGEDSRGETTSEAISRLAGELYFNGVVTTKTLSTSEATETAQTVEALTPARIFFCESNNEESLNPQGGLFKQLENYKNTKTLLYTYGADSELNAKLFACAYASRLFAVNYSGSNTCITMNLKDLVGIEADTNISETLLQRCVDLGVDVFPSVEGLPKVLSNRKGVYYIDQVQNQIWFVNAIQRNVFNLLATTRTKIPQTEQGMQLITNAISDICKMGKTNGFIAPGKWNSADTFGVLEDFTRNIEEQGYYIYHLPVAQQLQAEREQRKAPMFQIAAKEAGAVHSANILIYVEA